MQILMNAVHIVTVLGVLFLVLWFSELEAASRARSVAFRTGAISPEHHHDPVKLQAVKDAIDANKAKIAAAVVANTPAAPSAPAPAL